MPDEAKMQALSKALFKLQPSCWSCRHFRPGDGGFLWGTCKSIPYTHGKHTGVPREASVPLIGYCIMYDQDAEKIALLGAHAKFIQK